MDLDLELYPLCTRFIVLAAAFGVVLAGVATIVCINFIEYSIVLQMAGCTSGGQWSGNGGHGHEGAYKLY